MTASRSRTASRRPLSPRIYAAHPMTTFGTDWEQTALDRIAGLVPGATIIDPATRYRNTAHWLGEWPEMLRSISGLVVFGDEDGSIGAGCLHELADAWRRGIPVAMLDTDGSCRTVSRLRVLPDGVRDKWRTAVLVPGRRVDPARRWLGDQ